MRLKASISLITNRGSVEIDTYLVLRFKSRVRYTTENYNEIMQYVPSINGIKFELYDITNGKVSSDGAYCITATVYHPHVSAFFDIKKMLYGIRVKETVVDEIKDLCTYSRMYKERSPQGTFICLV